MSFELARLSEYKLSASRTAAGKLFYRPKTGRKLCRQMSFLSVEQNTCDAEQRQVRAHLVISEHDTASARYTMYSLGSGVCGL